MASRFALRTSVFSWRPGNTHRALIGYGDVRQFSLELQCRSLLPQFIQFVTVPGMVFSVHRERRLQALKMALPTHSSIKPGRSMRELLFDLAAYYTECKNDAARVRAIQLDLQHLLTEGEIALDPASGERTSKRYRLASPEPIGQRNVNLDELYQDLLQRGISAELASDFVLRVQHPGSYFDLPPEQFVNVPDTVRLMPARPLDPTIQEEVLQAVRLRRVLKASYRKPGSASATDRRLYPIGILLRGPQHYLIAYDEKDLQAPTPPEKMFLIPRLEDALALDEPCKLPAEVSVADLVRRKGLADFVRDPELVTIRLRVWDYVLRLLEDNVIAPHQTVELEEDGRSAIVTAKVMLSGTLYRWLMGFGDKVEVLEPRSLRNALARQASAAAEYYVDIDDEEGD